MKAQKQLDLKVKLRDWSLAYQAPSRAIKRELAAEAVADAREYENAFACSWTASKLVSPSDSR